MYPHPLVSSLEIESSNSYCILASSPGLHIIYLREDLGTRYIYMYSKEEQLNQFLYILNSLASACGSWCLHTISVQIPSGKSITE